MGEWLDLIRENEEKILEAGKAAYKEALEATNLRIIVELDEDGNVETWGDVAGGNSFHESVFNGTSIEIMEFCFQFFDFEITDETIKQKFQEKGLKQLYNELEETAEENFTSVECEIRHGENQTAKDILEECQKDELEFMVSEFANDEAMAKLDQLKEQLEMMED